LDASGNLHYLIARLAETEINEELIVEMKKKGARSYVDVQRSAGEIPSINLDETSEETDAGFPTDKGAEDVFDTDF
jgi:hypothetical protein